ncbi:MAG TPA: 50S ribosomal protein L29 [Candidatus Saccharimonadales bacterium]|nr:50S ribosomal protein L29 [Candidatus Saccharimonadales bacterium]
MKKKDLEELKNKNIDQLKKLISEQEKEIGNSKFESESKTKNVHVLSKKRKDIARAFTVLSMKQLQETKNKEAKIEK